MRVRVTLVGNPDRAVTSVLHSVDEWLAETGLDGVQRPPRRAHVHTGPTAADLSRAPARLSCAHARLPGPACPGCRRRPRRAPAADRRGTRRRQRARRTPGARRRSRRCRRPSPLLRAPRDRRGDRARARVRAGGRRAARPRRDRRRRPRRRSPDAATRSSSSGTSRTAADRGGAHAAARAAVPAGRRRRTRSPSSDARPRSRVSGLQKSYGPHEALRGVDFEIEAGEVFGLLGPNGAGKTTTVEILEGYRRRDGGDVDGARRRPASTAGAAWRERIGVVLQSSAMYPNLTVEETPRAASPATTERRATSTR